MNTNLRAHSPWLLLAYRAKGPGPGALMPKLLFTLLHRLCLVIFKQ